MTNPLTSAEWAQRAALLKLSALAWHAMADQALIADQQLGHLNEDYCTAISRHYREMAQTAEATADTCREYAFDGAA